MEFLFHPLKGGEDEKPFHTYLEKRTMNTPRLDRLTREWASHQPFVAGQVGFVTTLHDDWCRFLNGKGDCNCNPVFTYEPRPIGPDSRFTVFVAPAPPAENN